MYLPMLASPMKKGNVVNWTDWAIEEKYDGHRLIVYVGLNGTVTAYARPRGDGRMIERTLPDHLRNSLATLVPGVYDGELLGGDVSTDVSRLDLAKELRFVVFDLLELHGSTTCHQTYDDRHLTLHRIFARMFGRPSWLSLATPVNLTKEADVKKFVERVWKAGGEGAILKRRAATYQAGKRSADWIKIKRVEHAALTVVGFQPSRGKVMGRGPFAIVVLKDEKGNETTCKTLNDFELKKFEQQAVKINWPHEHPAMGRKLVIEFFGRTRDGGYRGPVTWDRWEDE